MWGLAKVVKKAEGPWVINEYTKIQRSKEIQWKWTPDMFLKKQYYILIGR